MESWRGLWGVHAFGSTFVVGYHYSPCGDTKARMNHTSHIRVRLVPKDCVCPITNSLSGDPDLNPGLWCASPTLCALSQRGRQFYNIWWNALLDNEGIMQINVIVDRIWCCRLQLTLVLARPMCRNLTSILYYPGSGLSLGHVALCSLGLLNKLPGK